MEDGPAPESVVDVSLCERFGWTLDQLDEQDESRLLPGVIASNMVSQLQSVQAWMEAAGNGLKVGMPSARALQAWGEAAKALKEKQE